jgi:hypothetical protein
MEGFYNYKKDIYLRDATHHYIAGVPLLPLMRIDVIETCLAHDQKIEVQILYPHNFFFIKELY